MLTRILFVDDESRVLEGLRRTLRMQRAEWHMAFALGGEAALEELARAPYDVLVTDMRMPGVDGLALLTAARARWPHLVRIVLSGYMDGEAALRSASVAHQFLAKPCEPAALKDVIDRVRRLTELLGDPTLRAVVGEVSALATRPAVYAELERVIADPASGVDDVSRVVEREVSLTAKVLQVVNSAFFGLPRRVSTIAQSVAFLGVDLVRALVLSNEIAALAAGRGRDSGFSLAAHQAHAVRVARLAQRIAGGGVASDEAFLAGVLHDVGELLLASSRPEWLTERAAHSARTGLPPHESETVLFGVTHAEVGAYLVGLWGLPFPIVEAIAHHHVPSRVGRADVMGALAAVHIADALVEAAPLDAAYVEPMRANGRLDTCRAAAEGEGH